MTSLICFLTVCTDPRAHHTVYTDPQQPTICYTLQCFTRLAPQWT